VARVTLEDFGDKEVVRIYIAGALGEAKRVETILIENGIHYAVEVELYVRLSIFSAPEQAGAAFYVVSGQADFCRRTLREAGLKVGIIEDPLS
jgi:hypothetical protein